MTCPVENKYGASAGQMAGRRSIPNNRKRTILESTCSRRIANSGDSPSSRPTVVARILERLVLKASFPNFPPGPPKARTGPVIRLDIPASRFASPLGAFPRLDGGGEEDHEEDMEEEKEEEE
ncbi:hypothetical protein KM043_015341 [Ampulex compressa]|nr:hypothetical protein KM043_015341 [Ampulex compressa]